MFREKGCWEWIWGQERGKTCGSATSGILRRNNKHSLYRLDVAFPVLFSSRETQALGLRRLQKVKAGGSGCGRRGKLVAKWLSMDSSWNEEGRRLITTALGKPWEKSSVTLAKSPCLPTNSSWLVWKEKQWFIENIYGPFSPKKPYNPLHSDGI